MKNPIDIIRYEYDMLIVHKYKNGLTPLITNKYESQLTEPHRTAFLVSVCLSVTAYHTFDGLSA